MFQLQFAPGPRSLFSNSSLPAGVEFENYDSGEYGCGMADFSFDIVSKADRMEVDNAVNQAIQQSIPVPKSIASLYGKKKLNQKIGSYSELKELLSSN